MVWIKSPPLKDTQQLDAIIYVNNSYKPVDECFIPQLKPDRRRVIDREFYLNFRSVVSPHSLQLLNSFDRAPMYCFLLSMVQTPV